MPEIKQLITAVGSEIGRGHPAYLDSVIEALSRQGYATPVVPAQGLGWRLARRAYRIGAGGGPLTAVYNRMRGRRSRLELALLDSGLRTRFDGFKGILLVDHPLLAHLLAPVCRVAYIHGEIAAPPVSAVPGAWRTFVPLEQTAARLETYGVRRETVAVSGLVIEPALVAGAPDAFKGRVQRLSSNQPLTVAFFTSGAYPKPHMRQLVLAGRSAAAAGHRVIAFCGTDHKKATAIGSRLKSDGQVLVFDSRPAETERTAELFSQLDVMVAAAHERTNWAVGLGLPLFALLPHIGPFALENFRFALAQGVCLPLEDASAFGAQLTSLRNSGKLAAMACAGWGKYPITGAQAVAASLRPSV